MAFPMGFDIDDLVLLDGGEMLFEQAADGQVLRIHVSFHPRKKGDEMGV